MLATIYFAFISKHWFWFVLVGFITLLIVDISALWLPESPKYLLKMGRKLEAVLILKRIAKSNNVVVDIEED